MMSHESRDYISVTESVAVSKVTKKPSRGCCSPPLVEENVTVADDKSARYSADSTTRPLTIATSCRSNCTESSESDKSAVLKRYEPNMEGEDPVFPEHLHSITQLAVYGIDMSPPCAALRTLLTGYNVNFENVDLEIGILSGPKAQMKKHFPNSEYLKMPITVINGSYQVNDSYSFTKFIAPYLSGEELDENMLSVLKFASNDFVKTLEMHVFCDPESVSAMVDKYMPDRFAITKFGIRKYLSSIGERIAGEDIMSVSEVQEKMVELGKLNSEGIYFHGEQPGVVDFYVFGQLHTFTHAKCPVMKKFIKKCKMSRWYDTIRSRLPVSFC